MEIDNRTLAIVFVGIALVLSAALAMNAITRRDIAGPGHWALGTFVMGLGYSLLGLQGFIPRLFGVVLANTIIVAGVATVWRGIDLFLSIRRPAWAYWSIPAFHFAASLAFTYAVDDTRARIILITACVLVVCVLEGHAMLSNLPPRGRTAYVATGIVFAVSALAYLVRLVAGFSIAQAPDLYSTGTFVTASFLASNLGMLTSSLGLMLVTKTRFELDLEDKIDQLERTVGTRDKLFSLIAHDLRGPITGMTNLLDLLLRDRETMKPELVEEFLRVLQASTWSTRLLLENLLIWSLDQQGELAFSPRVSPLREAIDESLSSFSLALRQKDIKAENRVPAGVRVFADEKLLQTIVRNLVSNAIKYSHRGGAIEIEAREEEAGTEVVVRDNGVGMTEEVRSRLFGAGLAPTLQGTAGEIGSGIGLSLCRDFVERHGGMITAASVEGGGSEFLVRLPRPSNGVPRLRPTTPDGVAQRRSPSRPDFAQR